MQSKHLLYMGLLLKKSKRKDLCIGKALPLKVDAALLKAYGKLRQLVFLLKSLVIATEVSPKCLP